jgi:hypothetical protein
MFLKALVCAVALWILSSHIAEASLVQVVRVNPSGWGWITVAGDLETPEKLSDPINIKRGITPESPFNPLLAPSGIWIGRWENGNFGPIFADVLFSKTHMMDLAWSTNPLTGISIANQLSPDNSTGGGVFGDWNSLSGSSGSFSSFDGALSGYIPGSISGEISGTTGGSVDVVLSGQLDSVSSVPLPDAVWLFTTGLVGWIVLVNHRTWVRLLGQIK